VASQDEAPLALSATYSAPIDGLPFVRPISPFDRQANPPRGPSTRWAFAPSICIEAMLPGKYNKVVRDGAEFLVNVTDDGWFGDTAEAYQHLQAATMRAVETRRWLVRASNSGISASIDPTGRIVSSLPFGAVGVMDTYITPSSSLSLYVRYGNWPVLFCLLHVLFMVTARIRNPIRGNR